jgi:hypothetical protein
LDPVENPGHKAVIFFTGEGKIPHFEVLDDCNNKRTVDYVDGFDEVRVGLGWNFCLTGPV